MRPEDWTRMSDESVLVGKNAFGNAGKGGCVTDLRGGGVAGEESALA